MKYTCPECNSTVNIVCSDLDQYLYSVNEDGSLKEINSDGNRELSIYCTRNKEHVIPSEMQQEITDKICEILLYK